MLPFSDFGRLLGGRLQSFLGRRGNNDEDEAAAPRAAYADDESKRAEKGSKPLEKDNDAKITRRRGGSSGSRKRQKLAHSLVAVTASEQAAKQDKNHSSISCSYTMKDIVDNDSIRDDDVLCGRGAQFHIGNSRYRKIVMDYHSLYVSSLKFDKQLIAGSVIRMIRDRGGRFLSLNKQGEWVEIDDERALVKCGQALRDAKKLQVREGDAAISNAKRTSKFAAARARKSIRKTQQSAVQRQSRIKKRDKMQAGSTSTTPWSFVS